MYVYQDSQVVFWVDMNEKKLVAIKKFLHNLVFAKTYLTKYIT